MDLMDPDHSTRQGFLVLLVSCNPNVLAHSVHLREPLRSSEEAPAHPALDFTLLFPHQQPLPTKVGTVPSVYVP